MAPADGDDASEATSDSDASGDERTSSSECGSYEGSRASPTELDAVARGIRPEQAYVGVARALLLRRELRQVSATPLSAAKGTSSPPPRDAPPPPHVVSKWVRELSPLRSVRQSLPRASSGPSPYVPAHPASSSRHDGAPRDLRRPPSPTDYSEQEWDRDSPRRSLVSRSRRSRAPGFDPDAELFRPRHPRRLSAISRWRELAAPHGPHESTDGAPGPLRHAPAPLDPETLELYEAAVFGGGRRPSPAPSEEYRRVTYARGDMRFAHATPIVHVCIPRARRFLRVAVVDTPADVLDPLGVARAGTVPMAALQESTFLLPRPAIALSIRVRQMASMPSWPEPIRDRDHAREESMGAEFTRMKEMVAHYTEVEHPELIARNMAPPTTYHGTWDVGGPKKSISKSRRAKPKRGKYERPRRDRERLYIQGLFVNKDRIHRAAAFVGGRYCILCVFGVGITGRMPRLQHVAENVKSVPRHLIIDAFDPAACMSVSVPVTLAELSELFDHNDWIFAPGRKRDMCRAVLDRLCFSQSEEAERFMRTHGRAVQKKSLALARGPDGSPTRAQARSVAEPAPVALPPRSTANGVVVIGNDVMFLSNVPRQAVVHARVMMLAYARAKHESTQRNAAAAELERLAAGRGAQMPRRRSSVTFVAGERIDAKEMSRWLETRDGVKAAPDDFSSVAVLSKGSGTLVAASGATGVGRRRLSVVDVEVVGSVGDNVLPPRRSTSAGAAVAQGRRRAAFRGGTRLDASDAAPGLRVSTRLPIGAHALQPSDPDMRIVYRTARRLSGRLFLVTVSEDLTQPQNFHIAAYDPVSSEVYEQRLSVADLHSSILVVNSATPDGGGVSSAARHAAADPVRVSAADGSVHTNAWRLPSTAARRRRAASPLAHARAAAASSSASSRAVAPSNHPARARATLSLRHDTRPTAGRRRSNAERAASALKRQAGSSGTMHQPEGTAVSQKSAARTWRSKSLSALRRTAAAGQHARSLDECRRLVNIWRAMPVVSCALSVRRPIWHDATVVLGLPNAVASGGPATRRALRPPRQRSTREVLVAFNSGVLPSAFSAVLVPNNAAKWPPPPAWSRAHRYEAARRLVRLLDHTGTRLDVCGRSGLPGVDTVVRASAATAGEFTESHGCRAVSGDCGTHFVAGAPLHHAKVP